MTKDEFTAKVLEVGQMVDDKLNPDGPTKRVCGYVLCVVYTGKDEEHHAASSNLKYESVGHLLATHLADMATEVATSGFPMEGGGHA